MSNLINLCSRLTSLALPSVQTLLPKVGPLEKKLVAKMFTSPVSKAYVENQETNHERQYGWMKFLVAITSSLTLWTFYKLNERPVFAAKPFKNDELDKNMNYTGRGDEKPKTPISSRVKYNFIADVVEKVAGSVVCIVIRDFEVIDYFTGTPKVVSNGSGFLISDDGLIVTNAHVILGSERPSISVRLADGRNFAARVEHVDTVSDLATIRIKANNLKPLPLGCSSETRLGEWVVALGSPLSLANTVTAGVVSSVNRGASEIGIKNDIDYIQTDAAITFGNSGGPLVNLDGEVIGINSMKVTAGISFAIPIDHVKKFLGKCEDLKRSGQKSKSRRYVGLTMLTLSEDILAELQLRGKGMDIKHGVIVWRVIVGSPAFFCGIQPGDIIMRINDNEIASAADVHNAIATHETLRLLVRRDNKNIEILLTSEDVQYD